MMRNNLEKNIRDKMKERELQPSANAWDKLESQLDAAPQKRKMVFWYYTAASVVGLMLIGSVVYYQHSEEQPQLVEENIKENQIENTIDVVPKVLADQEPVVTESTSTPIENYEESASENEVTPLLNVTEVAQKSDDIVFKTTITNEKISPEIIETVEWDKNYEYQKAQEVAIDIRTLQKNRGAVTIEEVEELLANARSEIILNRTTGESQINATTLLNEVEWELDKTFYDKVFDALGEGFRKIATAYTERNK